MSRTDLQVNFRMPASLKEELEALARANRRSLTAEIVARLERSISDPDELGISDRDRLNGNDLSGYEAPTGGVSKEKLLQGLGGRTPRENVFIASMLKALRDLDEMPGQEPSPPRKKSKRIKPAE
ncbi:Arc family DNA-binding protein [Pseudomonas otitidis]|uniref:Arc family DNA-binding protein n=1 Tax=Metapseudomonas otitidis TaxID=319939 RepID=A0A7X3H556_9GAMM|nr:Arc family DNA-binding protein [Pseudomonas otitidis]MWK54689.1 Arc family DNA-binding protein [Pseudomonas otitidis]